MLRGLYIAAIVIAFAGSFFTMIQGDKFIRSYYRLDRSHYDETTQKYIPVAPDPADVAAFENTRTIFIINISVHLLFFILLYVLTLIRLKTTTMFVLGIIGISLSALIIPLFLMQLAQPRVTRDLDVFIALMAIYDAVMLGFSITGTVHAFRKGK